MRREPGYSTYGFFAGRDGACARPPGKMPAATTERCEAFGVRQPSAADALPTHVNRVLRCATVLAIPKGLSPPAQGRLADSPTLGPCPNEIINRNAVAAFPLSRPRATLAATALRLELLVARGPKVAAARQPWALGWNPFGIQGEPGG